MNISEETITSLISAAQKARMNAYAPYSGFAVGAAVLADDGCIHSGCNVENASYGLTVCAERNAVLKAVSHGAKSINAVAVVADSAEPAAPCGACLQVIAEFASHESPIILANMAGKKIIFPLCGLLPNPFVLKKEL